MPNEDMACPYCGKPIKEVDYQDRIVYTHLKAADTKACKKAQGIPTRISKYV